LLLGVNRRLETGRLFVYTRSMHTFRATITKDLAIKALHRFYFKTIGTSILFLSGFLIVISAWDIFKQHFVWTFYSQVAVLVFLIVVIGFSYFLRRNRISKLYAKGDSLEVTYELNDENYTASSSYGSVKFDWSKFHSLWIFPECWLLFYQRNGYLTLPLDQLSSEIQEFIKKKAQGKIR
jgi:hypothetical protein